jgi:hypothetical protein
VVCDFHLTTASSPGYGSSPIGLESIYLTRIVHQTALLRINAGICVAENESLQTADSGEQFMPADRKRLPTSQ